MKAIIEYFSYVDMVGLVLAVLLVWRANWLDKRDGAFLKQADADSRQMPQHL